MSMVRHDSLFALVLRIKLRFCPKGPILREGIANVNELSRHLSDKSRNLEIEINETFDRLLRLVEDRRSGTLADLQQREAAKQDTLGKTVRQKARVPKGSQF